MVFQSYALYPHMSVAENMGFSLKLARADKKVRRALGERVIVRAVVRLPKVVRFSTK